MKEFRDYDIRYPDLVYDIVDYFRIGNKIKEPIKKSVIDYCENSRLNTQEPNGEMIQPDIVYKICEILTNKRVLRCTRVGVGIKGLDSNYIFLPGNDEKFLKNIL